MASLMSDDDDPEEQLYLLEVIINDVDVIREGILETLAEEPFLIKDTDGSTQEAEDNEPKEAPAPGGAKEGEKPPEPKEGTAKRSKKKINTKAPLRVLVRFFDFPTIEVPETEFGTEDQPEGSGPMKGKTCLFPMVPKQMMEVIRKHSVEIQVRRDAKRGPARVIGMTRFNLGQEFIDAVALANTPTMLPVSTFVEGEYDASNVFGEVTASVHLLLRLSCFGSTIFSQFKNFSNDKGYRFAEGYVDGSADHSGMKKIRPDVRAYQAPAIPREVDLGLQSGRMMQECHINPADIPWRKLHEDPVDPRVCGPKRLFKEQWSKKEESTCVGGMPWLQAGSALERSLCPGGICCGGQSSTSGVLVPPEFGNRLPSSVKKLLPSQRRTLYQIPLNMGCSSSVTENFPESNPTYICSDKTYSGQPKIQCEGVCAERTACGRLCPAANCATNMGNQPLSFGGPNTRPGQKDFPSLEESSPPLKSAPPDKVDNVSSIGALKRDMEYIPCPNNPDIRPANTGKFECGLGALIDQRNQNVHNLLQPTLLAPKCPPDAMGKRRPSLCTCPKVPTVIFEPPGGVIRCECSNILASLKPIELPYTCPPQDPKPPSNGAGTCPPCPPVPIRLPPPQPECPLVKLLKEAQNENLPSSARGNMSEAPNTVDVPSENKQVKKADDSDKQTDPDGHKSNDVETEDQGSKSREKVEELPKVQEKGQKKSKEGISKILREEVSKATTPLADGDRSNGGKRSVGSKASTVPGSEIGGDVSPPKKKKQKKMVDKGRGSATPTHMLEPQERELRIHYTPTAGLYPGFVIGHKNCVPIIPRVPKRMGWLWNVKDADGFLKPGKGWRPGSIQTNVMKVMDNVKTTGKQSSKSSTTGKIQGIVKTRSGDQHPKKVETNRQFTAKEGDAPTSLPMDLVPTLHVHKKHGLHYVSMVPPPKDRARKGKKIKHLDRGDMGDPSSGSEDDLPAQFRIDTKNPDGLPTDPNLYETDESSSYSEDSYQMEIVAPSSLRHRQPLPRTQDIDVQVTEENFVQSLAEGKGKKKSNVSKNSTLSHKGGKGRKHGRGSTKKK